MQAYTSTHSMRLKSNGTIRTMVMWSLEKIPPCDQERIRQKRQIMFLFYYENNFTLQPLKDLRDTQVYSDDILRTTALGKLKSIIGTISPFHLGFGKWRSKSLISGKWSELHVSVNTILTLTASLSFSLPYFYHIFISSYYTVNILTNPLKSFLEQDSI